MAADIPTFEEMQKLCQSKPLKSIFKKSTGRALIHTVDRAHKAAENGNINKAVDAVLDVGLIETTREKFGLKD